jgi:gustatory receptor
MLKLSHVDKILMPDTNCIHKRMSAFVTLELVVFVFLLLARHGYELWSRGGKQYVNIIIRFVIHFMSTIMIIQFVSFIHVLKQRFRCVNRQLSLLGGINDRRSSLDSVRTEFAQNKFGITTSHNAVVAPHAEDVTISNSLEQVSAATSVFLSDTEIGRLSSTASSKFRTQSHLQEMANIHTLRCVHTILYDICGLVNSVYGFQLLLAMAYIFMSVVKYFHVVMISNASSPEDQLSDFRVDGIVPLMCVVSIHIANVLWVTASCSWACFEAGRTTILVNKFLLIQPLSSDISAELERFSQQLLHSKLHFTAFGFFSLDFTFLYGFVGGATTYIVILLQFQ